MAAVVVALGAVGYLAIEKPWISMRAASAAFAPTPHSVAVLPFVNMIAQRLPGARVGTVDKFQGQEAPVVIYSTTISDPEDAPHGMEFLFNRNRLNVATSRAKCVCILVGNPRLFEPECRTPQMRLANAFCRYLEVARQIELASAPQTREPERS